MTLGIDVIVPSNASAAPLGITVDIFEAANRISGARIFETRLLGVHETVRLRAGLSVPATQLCKTASGDMSLVIGQGRATRAELDVFLQSDEGAAIADWLRVANEGGTELAAACTGVFALGAAGALDGRQCTTTWWLPHELTALYPLCKVRPDAMVIEDRGVWTAGAAFAQIDLILAIVSRKAGAELAREVGRHLVIDQRMSQSEYLVPVYLAAGQPWAAAFEQRIRGDLASGSVTLRDLAASMGTTSRTLARRTKEATGLSPMRFVQKVRLDETLTLLGSTRLGLSEIARRVGLSDAATLHRLVVRQTGRPPGRFRPKKT